MADGVGAGTGEGSVRGHHSGGNGSGGHRAPGDDSGAGEGGEAVVANGGSSTVLVRYFGAARAAAGASEEKLTMPDPATVDDVLRFAVEKHGRSLERVLRRCSYLLGEVAVHDSTTEVTDGAEIDVLPPFAGGSRRPIR